MSFDKLSKDVATELDLSDEYLGKLVDFFVVEAAEALNKDTDRGLPMIPSFVTKIPTGKEQGFYLAADLGGSNFRVCSVRLNGDSTTDMKQMKWAVSKDHMNGGATEFWDYLADRTKEFLEKFHSENCAVNCDNKLKMGFTFSFPIHQTGVNRGTLIRWTKGYNIKEAVGTDVCQEFQKSLDKKMVPVHLAALINDTVGCLLARSYQTGSSSQTVVGSILGTGTNAAYSEKIKRIEKLPNYNANCDAFKDEKIMIINTEWGSFDNDLKILPRTEVDREINLDTPNPNFHMFEKRVSGMYLGEIARRTLQKLNDKYKIFTMMYKPIPLNADLYIPWSTDTSFLSYIASDVTDDLSAVAQQLERIGVSCSSLEERQSVKSICHSIARRAARLVAAIIAGLLKKIRAFEKFEVVDVGMDGAVIEFYPGFEEMMREAWRGMEAVGPEKEKRITIGISKDGSGIGAALCAALA